MSITVDQIAKVSLIILFLLYVYCLINSANNESINIIKNDDHDKKTIYQMGPYLNI